MRMTRAAIRAQAQEDEMPIHVDADAAGDEQLDGEQLDRAVLKDITEVNSSPTTDGNTEMRMQLVENAKGGKKGTPALETREGRGDATQSESGQQPPDVEGLSQQDDPEVATESTDIAGEENADACAGAEEQTPQRGLSSTSKTPKSDADMDVSTESQAMDDDGPRDDSFVDSIKSRSPTKLSRESAQADSFVEDITSRTPIRPKSRIEDSVDAIDALEDAIEQVSGRLPQLDHLNLESPVKLTKKTPDKLGLSPLHGPTGTKKVTPLVRKTGLDTKRLSKTPTSAKKPLPKKVPKQNQSTPARISAARLSTAESAKSASTVPKSPSKPATAMAQVAHKTGLQTEARGQLSFSNSPPKQRQQTNTKKRATSGSLSTSRPGFVPAKSSKAPTRSNFSLPGEAIAAKMKAQREERAKKEEEEQNRQSFKARPAPRTTSRPSVAPRENRASQARISAIRSGSNKENVMPRQVPAAVSNPATSVTVTKTRPDANKANSSVRRTSLPPKPTSTTLRESLAPRVASLTAGQKLTVSRENAAQQKAKGREVFGRAKMEKEAAEKEKREKEEATRKARAEAAERGRQASREWADKQKRRMEAVKAAKAAAGTEAGTEARTAAAVPVA
ncbi:hypothetical protein DV736_g2432, partial [Chaetothyriales sp. CBS 134916]